MLKKVGKETDYNNPLSDYCESFVTDKLTFVKELVEYSGKSDSTVRKWLGCKNLFTVSLENVSIICSFLNKRTQKGYNLSDFQPAFEQQAAHFENAYAEEVVEV